MNKENAENDREWLWLGWASAVEELVEFFLRTAGRGSG